MMVVSRLRWELEVEKEVCELLESLDAISMDSTAPNHKHA
jgi:hypothetical protein